MRKLLMFAVCAVVAFPLASIGGEKKRFDGEVSQWVSMAPNPAAGLIPIGGAGQINGGFVVSERNGIQIGIRASERYLGLLPSVREKNVGVYLAETGPSAPPNAPPGAFWNYDVHVDLRGGFGVAKGKTLSDYTLTLESDIAPFFPIVISDALPANTVLFQTSQNPVFGNPGFDIDAPGTYHFVLTLTPATFNGAPIVAAMSVEVVKVVDP